jgi:hypothetical protein
MGQEAPPGAAATAPPPRHIDTCPKEVTDFQGTDATAKLVEKCLGRPYHTNQNPDGRFIYMYMYVVNGRTFYFSFLFDKDGVLIRQVIVEAPA